MRQATRQIEDSSKSLFVAFELSRSIWKLAFSDGSVRPARMVNVKARDLARVGVEIGKAKASLGLKESTKVYSCYEAGRDGFWLHRFLEAQGVENQVVDAASIAVDRRKRRAKTDRLDAVKLVTQLVRFCAGERRVWSVVREPPTVDEDARQLHRDLDQLRKERRTHLVRIQSLFFSQGIEMKVRRGLVEFVAVVRLWDGSPLPTTLQQRILREHRRLMLVEEQIREVERRRRELLAEERPTPQIEKVKRMAELRGIGTSSAWVYVMEFFGWRRFANRRQVAAAAGLTPTPYQSGHRSCEQGISKAGNKRLRSLTVELAWCWLRYQPESTLSAWFKERFAGGGSRTRRVGIVALARRLLVALWRFIDQGVVPEGALLKS